MTDEMVGQIVEQVMAALKARGVAAPPPPPAAAPLTALAPPDPNAKPAAAQPQKTFITAEMLQRRLAAEDGDGRAIELASCEFLTPAAMDLVDERHLTVRKAAATLPKPADADGRPPADEPPNPAIAVPETAGRPYTASLGLVTHRPDEKVRSVLAGLARESLSVVDYSQTDCWVCNVRLLCEAVVGGVVRVGAAVLPYAADAMVLANKVRGIRAVQGTRPESVAAAMRHFAPNLLVVEHTFSTYHEMRAMVREFSAAAAGAPPTGVLTDNIAELERA